MVAVVQQLRARGTIVDTDPGWALTTVPRREELGVPDEARELIRMQLESIAPADRAILEAASVAGGEFAVPTVAAALGGEATAMEARCEILARGRRFPRAAGSIAMADGAAARRYAFVHALYREACYEDIDEGRRRRLHQQVGLALEAAHGEDAARIAAELAHHFEQAGESVRAIRYLTAAATMARRRFAGREAAAKGRSVNHSSLSGL